MASSRHEGRIASVAFIGTRGVPARYGGFETAAEEIGSRLVEMGMAVRVYCRNPNQTLAEYRGMDLVNLRGVRTKSLDTLSHSAVSLLSLRNDRTDAAILFNIANSVFLPVLRRLRIATALHADGLEWKRGKWGLLGKTYFRAAEWLGARSARTLIADADAIATYYRERYRINPVVLKYGFPDRANMDQQVVEGFHLVPHAYHLVVARMEPENHVFEAVEAYRKSDAQWPMAIVGSGSYRSKYEAKVRAVAAGGNVRFLGAIYDQYALTQLYQLAGSYVHGHSVGGTNPSLLRAIGAEVPILAHANPFNHEVAGSGGRYWSEPAELAVLLQAIEVDRQQYAWSISERCCSMGSDFHWDSIAAGYYSLITEMLGYDRRDPTTSG